MELFRSKNDCSKTVNWGFVSSEDLLGVGPASQRVFSAGKTEVLKVITGGGVASGKLGRRGSHLI